MNNGLWISATGMATALYRMDVHANNLANVETPGFKPDSPTFRFRAAARQEQNSPFLPSNKLLEALGSGVWLNGNRTSTTQGPIQSNSEPLSVAIKGSGFLMIEDTRGPRLTRDGCFTLDESGFLVQASTGRRVLDTAERPIQLTAAVTPSISATGEISQNGEVVGRLGLVQVADPSRLRKRGDNAFDPSAAGPRRAAQGEIVQFAVEGSAVDPVRAMLDIGRAERGVSSASRMIQYHDELMNRTISTFGKVA